MPLRSASPGSGTLCRVSSHSSRDAAESARRWGKGTIAIDPNRREPLTPPYEIARYRPEFRDRVLRLQTHLWSPDLSLNDAYMRWKHEQNPYLHESLIYLALRGEDVVGMLTFFGTRWQIGSPPETFDALYFDDLVVLPVHRNQRLLRGS